MSLMKTLNEKYIKQLEDIMDEYEVIREKAIDKSYKPIKTKGMLPVIIDSGPPKIYSQDYNRMVTKAKAAIKRIAGLESEYYKRVEKLTIEESDNFENLERIMGVVEALIDDLKKGYLEQLMEIIHAELFGDFLEQAKYLLKKGYKDAAAVIAGTTMEIHFRKLCDKHKISLFKSKGDKIVPKTMDELKKDLAGKIISSNDINLITGWIQIRNKAAHGHYDFYTTKDIELMIQGIELILSKYTA